MTTVSYMYVTSECEFVW